MHVTLLEEMLIVLAGALAAGMLFRWLRLPVLTGYLCVGILLGNGGLGLVKHQQDQLEYAAEAGVFLLLFTIGLEFALDDLRGLFRNMVIGGGTQMMLVVVPVALLAYQFGASAQAAVLIGAACSFSSTVLVFKSLAEIGHATRPHGRRAIAILLFQDAALIPLVLAIPVLTGFTNSDGSGTPGLGSYLQLGFVSCAFLAAVVGLRILVARHILPFIASFRSVETTLLFALLAICGITWASYRVGLPPAVGAFASGLIFNGNRWTQQIDALVLPFRETFAAFFFIGLGLLLDTQLFWSHGIGLSFALGLLIIGKAAAATVAVRLTGLSLRASAGVGLGLAHIGEFAFVLVSKGAAGGVVTELEYQLVVALAVGSLLLTPILLKGGLRWAQRQQLESLETDTDLGQAASGRKPATFHPRRTLVVGAGPMGKSIASQLESQGHEVCLLDRNPVNLQPFAQQGFHTIVGEGSNVSILKHADLPQTGLAVVCVPHDPDAISIVQVLRRLNPELPVVVRCRYQANVSTLRKAGAELIIAEEVQVASALIQALLERENQNPERTRETVAMKGMD